MWSISSPVRCIFLQIYGNLTAKYRSESILKEYLKHLKERRKCRRPILFTFADEKSTTQKKYDQNNETRRSSFYLDDDGELLLLPESR